MSLLLPLMINASLQRLRDNEPPEGYHLSFSGGKDSIVCHALAVEAGVKFTAHMGLTTVDPPEVLAFVRKHYPSVVLHKPPLSMFQLIVKKGILPMRVKGRYCCQHLKEYLGHGGTVVTGVRWAESPRRRTRSVSEPQQKKRGGMFLNPIVDWSDGEVWEYIKSNGLAYPSLYDEGYSRIGCILCPMQSARKKAHDIARFPKFAAAYKLAIRRMLETRKERGKPCDRMFSDVETCFKWWTEEKKWEEVAK